MPSPRRLLLTLMLFACAAFMTAPAGAQTPAWPTRPVRFIIPIGAGSGADITARLFADKLSQKWGQAVVVENRPGGDAYVAIMAVVNAHDDHMLLFAPTSTFTAHPLLHDTLPYKPDDLVPIARVTNTLVTLAVPTDIGVTSMKAFADKIKAAPGKLNYASVTGANDLLFASFLKTEKLDMAKVPYRDTVQAINDLAEGRIQAFVGAYAIMRPRVQEGKVRVLALTNPKHAAALNDIPTAREAGFPSLEFDGLVGVFGPKGFPNAVSEKIAKDIRDIANDPDIAAKLSATGQVVNPGTPEEFAAAVKEQRDDVARIGKILDIKPAQ
ncbi:MAG TPA: tripartite tricarboxylate transporter substrate binding protein [Pseudolabrys sp.]|jgi:tripartite-type tricarboxylate transporter receptor subunit TctC|nr:tripartite tricarboxylate transporter substrate binding protein [Pseudolabrys sp.]